MMRLSPVAKTTIALLVWTQVGCATVSNRTITIESDPAGAEVIADGYFKGRTPIELEVSSKCQITLIKVGHQSHTIRLADEENGNDSFSVSLKKQEYDK